LVDEVDYGVGFPWPTAADGGTASFDNLPGPELTQHAAPGSAYDYVEFHNMAASSALILDGVMLSGGMDYTFPPGTVLDQVRESVRNEASYWQVQTR